MDLGEAPSVRPKLNDILASAWAQDCTVLELAGYPAVAERLECSVTDHSTTGDIRRELSYYLELDAYLEGQGISPQV